MRRRRVRGDVGQLRRRDGAARVRRGLRRRQHGRRRRLLGYVPGGTRRPEPRARGVPPPERRREREDRLAGYFVSHPPADTFDASADVDLRIQDAAGHDVVRNVSPGTCRSGSRRIVCRENGRIAVFRGYTSAPPSQGFRLRVLLRRLAIDPPFSGPLTATMTYGPGPTRSGTLSTCSQTVSGMRCRRP